MNANPKELLIQFQRKIKFQQINIKNMYRKLGKLFVFIPDLIAVPLSEERKFHSV